MFIDFLISVFKENKENDSSKKSIDAKENKEKDIDDKSDNLNDEDIPF